MNEHSRTIRMLNNICLTNNEEPVRKVVNLGNLMGEDALKFAFYRQIIREMLSFSYNETVRRTVLSIIAL